MGVHAATVIAVCHALLSALDVTTAAVKPGRLVVWRVSTISQRENCRRFNRRRTKYSALNDNVGVVDDNNELDICHRLRIEVPPTAFRAETLTLTVILTLTSLNLIFNPMTAMVMTYTHAKDQDQKSLDSKVRVETHGRTDRQTEEGGDYFTLAAVAIRYNTSV